MRIFRDIDARVAAALARMRRSALIQISRMASEGVRLEVNGNGIDEVRDARLMQHYGFASAPLVGGEAAVLWLGPDSKLTIATEDLRHRLELKDGEVALYTHEGDRVLLKKGREIEVESGGKVTIKAPLVRLDAGQVDVTGALDVEGDITSGGKVEGDTIKDSGGTLGALRIEYGPHIHADPSSGVTGGPLQP